jgi:hypothetical protein
MTADQMAAHRRWLIALAAEREARAAVTECAIAGESWSECLKRHDAARKVRRLAEAEFLREMGGEA